MLWLHKISMRESHESSQSPPRHQSHGRSPEIPLGRGALRAKAFKGKYEDELEFSEDKVVSESHSLTASENIRFHTFVEMLKYINVYPLLVFICVLFYNEIQPFSGAYDAHSILMETPKIVRLCLAIHFVEFTSIFLEFFFFNLKINNHSCTAASG